MPEHALPIRTVLSFASGSLTTGIFNAVPSALLLFFMTTVLAVPASMAALTLFIPKIIGVISDPLVGRLSDRTQSRWGRRRPFLLWGGLVLCISFVAIFSVPTLDEMWARFAYVLFWYTIASLAYAAYSVPYIALPSEMSSDSNVRAKLMGWRMTFVMTGLVLGSALAPQLVSWFGGGRQGYSAMALVLGGVALAGAVIAFAGTPTVRWQEHDRGHAENTRPWDALKNPSFAGLLAAMMLLFAAVGAISAILPYLATFVLNAEGRIGTLFLAFVGSSLATALIWPMVGRRWGKVNALTCALFLFALGGGLILVGGSGSNFPLIASGLVLCGVSFAGGSVMSFALLTDVIADDRQATGYSREGLFTGVWTAIEKVGMAFGPILVGAILDIAGFVESQNGAVEQSAAALSAIIYSASLLPASIMLLAILFLFYPPVRRLNRIGEARAS
jgi:glycoside/pentoside/hexuronide:cation symporter, GPH family